MEILHVDMRDNKIRKKESPPHLVVCPIRKKKKDGLSVIRWIWWILFELAYPYACKTQLGLSQVVKCPHLFKQDPESVNDSCQGIKDMLIFTNPEESRV